MDLLQSALRTLYYDVNIERVMLEAIRGQSTFLKSDFACLSAWTNQKFTRSELSLLQSFVLEKTAGGLNPKWHHSLLLLTVFTDKCLKCDPNCDLSVRFEELQYWRELTLLTGEDLFTTSILAFNTLKGNSITCFDWPNIIKHDEPSVNQVLEIGLCDAHAHLKASADIFELTWLDLMNRVLNRDEDYKEMQYLADINLQSKQDEKTSSFRKMVQVAVILRMCLYEYLQGKSSGNETRLINAIMDDDKRRTSCLIDIQSKISIYKKTNNSKYDYACIMPLSANIYSIHTGERNLLYNFFRRYYNQDALAIQLADLFFLYISLKIRIRKEFVQTNPLYGFENFKIYESRKSNHCDKYKNLYPLYAVQSTIRSYSADGLEARVTFKGIPTDRLDIAIDEKTPLGEINTQSFSYIVHFIKKNERKVHKRNFGMRYDYKANYAQELQLILCDIDKRNHTTLPGTNVYKIVGIDAAGEEIECSPAVFGHVYRYARLCNMTNLTYHVGEDFYDIADGLKNIDDAIRFLCLKKGSRLGHAIALGVNADSYYKNRGYQVIMSKQRLLDVLVWLRQICKRAGIYTSSSFEDFTSQKVKSLYIGIGYGCAFDEISYYQSMLLRSDDPVAVVRSKWNKSSLCDNEECFLARSNTIAQMLTNQFLASKSIWEKGNEVDLFRYPPEIGIIIKKVQNYMMAIIAKKGIAIETCPSSNVKIGPIGGYKSHPVFRFMTNGLNVSINTDDKGIFATSLSNEYSLIANAYYQNGHTITESVCLIEKLQKQAWEQRFKEQELSIT